MRVAQVAMVAFIGWTALAHPCWAGVRISQKTTTYPIVGKTGEQLLAQMDRKGPKHGFLTRAIAQTRYAVRWDIDWTPKDGGCRVSAVAGRLDLTYSYPEVVSKISPQLATRWAAFMRGVRKHEEKHGAIARRMVAAAEAAVSTVSFRKDPSCSAARAEVRKRIAAAYAKYEGQQRKFDEVEHREGGNVAYLVNRLTR